MITGGGDGVLRLWDVAGGGGGGGGGSYIVAGFPPDDDDDDMNGVDGGSSSSSSSVLPPPPPPPQRLRSRAPRVFSRRVLEGCGVVVVDEGPLSATTAASSAAAAAAAASNKSNNSSDNFDPFCAESTAGSLVHGDAVTALASVVGQGGVRLLLSGGRDGVVKVWR